MAFSKSQKSIVIILFLTAVSGSVILGYTVAREYPAFKLQKIEPVTEELDLTTPVVVTRKMPIKKLTKMEKEKLQESLKININTASLEELTKLPYVGPKKAENIIADRPYRRIEDIMRVSGFGEKTFEKLKDHITAAGAGLDDYKPSTGKSIMPGKKRKPWKILKININTASLEELTKLSYVGPKKAEKIIAGRPYRKIEDIMRVPGFGEKTFEKLKDHITAAATGLDDDQLSPERTKTSKERKKAQQAVKININTASSAQLQELPGIGPKTAEKIIGGRPYKRIRHITRVHGIGEKTFARLKDNITTQ